MYSHNILYIICVYNNRIKNLNNGGCLGQQLEDRVNPLKLYFDID